MSTSRQSTMTAFPVRLTDAEWAVLEPLVPANRPGGRPPKYARRAVLDVNRIPNFPLPGTIPSLAATRPTVPLRTTDMFAQGISFSVQYTW